MSVSAASGFEFRCGGRRWKVHAVTKSQLDPIIGISVYIVDIYTHGKVDEEWLHGRNAKLCKGRAVLADNLVLAAAPLGCKPSASAFRIRMESIERIRAHGEIGSCHAAELEDPAEGRDKWIDVSATRPATTPRAGGGVHVHRPLAAQDRDPTPPPLLRDGIVLYDHLEHLADSTQEMTIDEQTTARLPDLVLAVQSKVTVTIDASTTNPRTGDTLRVDRGAYPWTQPTAAYAWFSDDTQILSRDELETVLGAAPVLRAGTEQSHDAGTATRTQVMSRGRR